jgi:hypothetical protein
MLATFQSRTSCLLVYHLKTKITMYKTIIMPILLCGCETLCVKLREEHTEGVENIRTKEG